MYGKIGNKYSVCRFNYKVNSVLKENITTKRIKAMCWYEQAAKQWVGAYMNQEFDF